MTDRSRLPGVLLAGALLLGHTAAAETLPQAIATAWATNPELAAARARQEALAETPEQARAGGRPTAELGGNAGYNRLGSGRSGSTGMTATLPIQTGERVRSAVRAASEGAVVALVHDAIVQVTAAFGLSPSGDDEVFDALRRGR